jgi:hypothetical protein
MIGRGPHPSTATFYGAIEELFISRHLLTHGPYRLTIRFESTIDGVDRGVDVQQSVVDAEYGGG